LKNLNVSEYTTPKTYKPQDRAEGRGTLKRHKEKRKIPLVEEEAELLGAPKGREGEKER